MAVVVWREDVGMVRSWEGGAKAEQVVLVRARAAAAAAAVVRWIAVMVVVYDGERTVEEKIPQIHTYITVA